MRIVFSAVHGARPSKTFGPLRVLRFDRTGLRETATGPVVALRREHQWELEGQRYFRVDTTSRVRIEFETANTRSRGFGPFQNFSAIAGIAYADQRVLAFLDERLGDWYCYNDGKHWAVMLVKDANDSSAKRVLAMLASLAPALTGVYGLLHGVSARHAGAGRLAHPASDGFSARVSATAALIARARKTVEEARFLKLVASGVRRQCAAT